MLAFMVLQSVGLSVVPVLALAISPILVSSVAPILAVRSHTDCRVECNPSACVWGPAGREIECGTGACVRGPTDPGVECGPGACVRSRTDRRVKCSPRALVGEIWRSSDSAFRVLPIVRLSVVLVLALEAVPIRVIRAWLCGWEGAESLRFRNPGAV